MSLREILSNYWFVFQRELFPALEEEIGPLGERYELFVTVLEFVRVERFLASFHALPGRPQEDRAALARAFIAKAVFQTPDHPGSDRAAGSRPTAASLVRLESSWAGPERGDLLARF